MTSSQEVASSRRVGFEELIHFSRFASFCLTLSGGHFGYVVRPQKGRGVSGIISCYLKNSLGYTCDWSSCTVPTKLAPCQRAPLLCFSLIGSLLFLTPPCQMLLSDWLLSSRLRLSNFFSDLSVEVEQHPGPNYVETAALCFRADGSGE